MQHAVLKVIDMRSALRTTVLGQAWWHRPLTPALRRQRQVDLCEFQASLGYTVNSRTAKVIQRNPMGQGEQGRDNFPSLKTNVTVKTRNR